MKRIFSLVPALLLVGAMTAPALQAQNDPGPRKGQGQRQHLRKRDGSCTKTGQGRGQGVRKQDGTGPRAGTPDCPKTPKTPAK